jgi:hypothetical protein
MVATTTRKLAMSGAMVAARDVSALDDDWLKPVKTLFMLACGQVSRRDMHIRYWPFPTTIHDGLGSLHG